MKSRKVLMKKVYLFLLICLLPASIFGEAFYIKNYDVIMQVGSDGILNVEEGIDVYFTEKRRGIIRNIPYRATIEGRERSMNLFDIDANVEAKITRRNGVVDIRLGSADRTIIGNKNYNIVYKASGAILTGNTNYDEIYWNAIGTEWDTTIDNAKVVMVFPDTLRLNENIDYRIYVGKFGATNIFESSGIGDYEGDARLPARALTSAITISGNKLIFEYPNRLSPNEGITVQIRIKKGMISISSLQLFIDNITQFFRRFFHIILAVLLFIFSFVVWYIWGKDEKVTVMVEFLPPDVSPSESSSILAQTAKFNIGATLVDLARRGYITIGKDNKRAYIERENSTDSGLRRYEKTLMKKIFSGKYLDKKYPDRVYTESLDEKFYTDYESIKSKFSDVFQASGFFEKEGNAWRGFFIFLSFASISLVVLSFLYFDDPIRTAIFAGLALINNVIFAFIMPRKTLKGLKHYKKTIGFKEFIRRAEKDRIKRLFNENPGYFDDTIAYAMVFGMAKKWGKMFDNILTQPPRWYKSDDYTLRRGFYISDFTNSLNRTIGDFNRTSVSKPPNPSGGSGWSGGGSWGGSAGGGFGGGGGSSW